MRRFWQLTIAVLGNALGTALMDSSNMGLTAWGIGAKNLSLYFDVSLGFGFIILSIFFYSISVIIRKKFILREFIESFAFLIAFSIFTNYFATIMPDISSWNFIIRLFVDTTGLFILLFAIAVHLKVMIAVHPMDVYMKTMQDKMKSVVVGTFFTYSSAFAVAIIFGLLYGNITGIGYGTIMTLLFGGIIIKLYNVFILSFWKFK
jgi:uncharacterized membrane protein YczE